MRLPGEQIWRHAAIPAPANATSTESVPGRPWPASLGLPGRRGALWAALACLAVLAVAGGYAFLPLAVTNVRHGISDRFGLSRSARRLDALGTLFYTVAGDERAAIFGLTGKSSTAITSANDQQMAAVASPDGRRIVYQHAGCPRCTAAYELRDLTTGATRVIGTAPARLGPNRGLADVAWANDSQRLAFTEKGLDSAQSRIFLLDTTSNIRRPLSPADPEQQESPVWSPDGRTVAYLAGGEGTIVTAVDVFTGAYLRLNDQLDHAAELTWSPDGRFLSLRRDGDLWLVDASDGHGFQLAVPGPVRETGGWAPGSRSLVVTAADRAVAGPSAPISVYVVPTDGSAPLRLSTAPKIEGPRWAADGRSIAWTTGDGDRWTIWRAPSTGGPATRLAAGAGSVMLNSWR